MEPIIRFETQNEMERIQLKRRKEYWRNQENMDIYMNKTKTTAKKRKIMQPDSQEALHKIHKAP